MPSMALFPGHLFWHRAAFAADSVLLYFKAEFLTGSFCVTVPRALCRNCPLPSACSSDQLLSQPRLQ